MRYLRQPTVSIIIPTYNRKNIVKEAVESVLNQSFRDYELIVVDDGSEDNTHQALLAFGFRIRYFFQPNTGPSFARNTGIHLARGEWISFLDSDDLWKKGKLKKQIEALQQFPQFKVCYTEETWIRNGKFVNPRKKHTKFSGWIYPYCLPLCIISPSSVIIHRSVFKEIGYFDTSLPVVEDYDLWLRISSRYPVKLLPQKLIIKRGGYPDQLSRKYWGIDRFRILSLEKMVKQPNLPINWKIATLQELAKKADIVARGLKKREKWNDYHLYSTKAKRAKEKIIHLTSYYNNQIQCVKIS